MHRVDAQVTVIQNDRKEQVSLGAVDHRIENSAELVETCKFSTRSCESLFYPLDTDMPADSQHTAKYSRMLRICRLSRI